MDWTLSKEGNYYVAFYREPGNEFGYMACIDTIHINNVNYYNLTIIREIDCVTVYTEIKMLYLLIAKRQAEKFIKGVKASNVFVKSKGI